MLQYIGARYVPIFYQNSLDPTSSEWEPNVTYEPLTWVEMLNGYMYISKKTVPDNIGSPASNPEYWLEAGQYNAYIQSLQDQIDDMKDGSVSGSLQNQINEMNDGSVSGSLQNQINEMNDGSVPGSLQNQIDTLNVLDTKKFIFFGDSYAVGFQPGGDEIHPDIEGFYKKTVSRLGLAASRYTLVEYGRVGFLGVGYPNNKTWRGDLYDLADDPEVTDIYVMGGCNDIVASASIPGLKTEIAAFINLAKQKFVNATVHIGFCGRQSVSTYFDMVNMRLSIQAYKDAANANGAEYLIGAENILKGVVSSMASDHYHPNVVGEGMLSDFVINHILGGQGRVHDDTYKQFTFIYNQLATGGLRLGLSQTEDSITITHVYSDVLSGTFTAQAFVDTSIWNIATLDGDELAGDAYLTCGGPCLVYVVADGVQQVVNGYIYFDNKTLKLKMYATTPDGSGPWQPTAITALGIQPFTFTIPKNTFA